MVGGDLVLVVFVVFQMNFNFQEFVGAFDGRAHDVHMFSTAADRLGVHHLGTQSPDSHLAFGEYGDVAIFAFQIIVTAACIANIYAWKTLQ